MSVLLKSVYRFNAIHNLDEQIYDKFIQLFVVWLPLSLEFLFRCLLREAVFPLLIKYFLRSEFSF